MQGCTKTRTQRSPMRLLLPTACVLAATALYASLAFRTSSVQAGTARKMDVEALVNAADIAFQGTILSKHARLGANNLIETEYIIAVKKTFWGEELVSRSVRLPGGVLPDGRGLVLAGMPNLVEREEVVLFLSAASVGGLRMPVGLAQGKFRVQRLLNGSTRLVRDSSELQLSNPATGKLEEAPPRSVYSYAQVTGEILAAVAARKARIKAQGK